MKEQDNKNDDRFFNAIMAESELQMPYNDFEEGVMAEIREIKQQQCETAHDLRLSWAFFIAGILLGVAISLLLPDLNLPVPEISTKNITLVFQVLFALFVLFHLEQLIGFTRKISLKNLLRGEKRAWKRSDG